MSEESILILNMLRDGKVTAEQADSLLRAVRTTAPPPSPPPPPAAPPPSAADAAALAQMQNKLGELQTKLGDLQGKLGAAQAAKAAGQAASLAGKMLDHLPRPDLDMGKVGKTVDEAMRGLSSLKNEALRTAKVAARQAGQEARRAARQGRQVFDDLGFSFAGDEAASKRPTNALALAEAQETADSAVTWAGASRLSLGNIYGSISVTGSDIVDSAAQATLTKTAWAGTDAEARVLLQQVFLVSRVEGGQCRVEVVAPADAKDKLTVDYTIAVPRALPLEINTTFGDITAEGAAVNLAAKTISGQITARRPLEEADGGAAHLSSHSGGVRVQQWNAPGSALSAETGSGDIVCEGLSCRTLALSTRSGDITATKVQTVAEASAEAVSGDVSLSGGAVGTRLSVKTQSGAASCADLRAEQVSIETVSGDARAQNLSGGLMVKTVSGDIDGAGIESASSALGTVSGDARWAFAAPFAGSLAGTTVSGDIRLMLQEGANARVEVSSTSGDVLCRLALPESAAHTEKLIVGTLGAGLGSIKLQSVSGDLTVEEQPQPDTAMPGKPPRSARGGRRPGATVGADIHG